MSWPQVKAFGQATGLSFRLRIEGFPVDWVTHPEMITMSADSSGRLRRVGLSIDGMKISQKVDIVASTVEASGITFKIADAAGAATAAFSTTPEETWMAPGTLDSTSTTLTVQSTVGFPASGYVWIDTEVMHYTSLGGGGTTFEGLTRARYDTLAQYHYSAEVGSDLENLRFPSVTSGPATIEGRRVYLYAYDRGDPLQGDGYQIWTGLVNNDASLLGPWWSISAKPISHILDQELGSDLGPSCQPRGIYYPGEPLTYNMGVGGFSGGGFQQYPWFWLGVFRTPYTSGTSTAIPLSATNRVEPPVYFPHPDFVSADNPNGGFFETQTGVGTGVAATTRDFIDAVNIQLAAITAGWGTEIICMPTDDGRYYFQLNAGPSPDGVAISIAYLKIEERGGFGEYTTPANPQGIDPIFSAYSIVTSATEFNRDDAVTALSQNTTYYAHPHPASVPGAGTVPRGVMQLNPGPGSGFSVLFNPYDRRILGTTAQVLYMSPIVPTNDMTALQISWSEDETVSYRVQSVSTAERSFTLERDDAREGIYTRTFTSANVPTFQLGRNYDWDPAAFQGTYNLLKDIEENCFEYANIGIMPIVRAGDWTGELLGEWWLLSASAPILAAARRYTAYKPIKLLDFVTPDLQLMGAYLSFDTTGRLTISRLKTALASEVPVLRITKDNLLTDKGPPSFEKIAYGSTNTFVLQEGYDPVEDKWNATPIMVRDVSAYGRNPNTRATEVKPKSQYVGTTRVGFLVYRNAVEYADAVAAAAPVLTIFGGGYAVMGLSVPLTGFDTVLGSVVSIDSHWLPDGVGERGIDAKGIVISREIDIMGGRIDLSVMITFAGYAGYAPSAMVESESLVSGTTWDITLDADYFRSGDVAADHYVTGDKVVVYVFDDETTTAVYGTVAAGSSGNVVRVTFVGTWTPGVSDWILAFSAAGPETSSMRQYGYGAGSDLRIDWDGSDSRRAFVFSISG